MLRFSDYQWIQVEVFWVSVVGIWLLYSLLALWVATREWHWWRQVALLFIAPALLSVIGARDLVLMQLFNCMTIFVLQKGWRAFSDWRGVSKPTRVWGKRLSLANLMFVMALLALLLAIYSANSKDHVTPSYAVGFGCAVGLAFMVGIGVTRIKSRWAIFAAVLVAAVGVYNAHHWAFPKLPRSSLYYLINPNSFIWGGIESFAKAILAAMTVAGLIIGYLHRGRQANRFGMMLARVGSGLAAVIILLLAISVIDLGARLAYRYPPPLLQSEESQFDKLSPIADRFESSTVFGAYPDADEKSLRTEIKAYEDDFAKIRAVLDTPETVPLPYHIVDLANKTNFGRWRVVARQLARKAQFELADGQVDQSLSSSVLAIRLREPNAGLMILTSELVSLAIEGIGQYSAAESIPVASRQAIADALEHVEKIDSRINDPELIFENDTAVLWRPANWYERMKMLYDARSMREMFDESIKPAIRRTRSPSKASYCHACVGALSPRQRKLSSATAISRARVSRNCSQ